MKREDEEHVSDGRIYGELVFAAVSISASLTLKLVVGTGSHPTDTRTVACLS